MVNSRRGLTLPQQAFALRERLQICKCHIKQNTLVCVFYLRPTEASRSYQLKIQYEQGSRPVVTVLAPPLALHEGAKQLPHVYARDDLCLHLPNEWASTDLIARTIVPWTAEWLYFYEIWLATGEWLGGGHDDEDEADSDANQQPVRPSTQEGLGDRR